MCIRDRAIDDEDFRDNTVDAGEIGAGHSVTALYEIKRHPDAEGKIATVFIRWEDPETAEVTEIRAEIDTEQLAAAYTQTSPSFQLAVTVSEFAEVLRESYWAQDNSLAGVEEEAQRVGRFFEESDDIAEFVDLVAKAARIPQE